MKRKEIVNNQNITSVGARHFVAGNFVSHARFIDPEVYGFIVRDNVVRTSVDVLIMDKKANVFLGKRRIYPWADWWTFGGAIKPGESMEEACARTVSRDLGLKIDPQQFLYIDFCSLVFDRRQENPQRNGCHDVSHFHLLALGGDEVFNLEKAEYDDCQWFNGSDIRVPDYHPALEKMIKKSCRMLRQINKRRGNH